MRKTVLIPDGPSSTQTLEPSMKILWPPALILFAIGIAMGQGHSPLTPSARTTAENPHERLAFLVGSFVTEPHILPGRMFPKESVGKGTSEVRWVLDSMFVFVDERSVNPVLGVYKGIGLLGYDPHDRQYVLSMYNNFGDHPQYRGSFAGDTLVLAARIPAPGKPFDQQVRWYPEGETVRLEVLNDTGEGFVPVITQVARRAQGSGTQTPGR
jgi:Protein of unknown function (DUF1579).